MKKTGNYDSCFLATKWFELWIQTPRVAKQLCFSLTKSKRLSPRHKNKELSLLIPVCPVVMISGRLVRLTRGAQSPKH